MEEGRNYGSTSVNEGGTGGAIWLSVDARAEEGKPLIRRDTGAALGSFCGYLESAKIVAREGKAPKIAPSWALRLEFSAMDQGEIKRFMLEFSSGLRTLTGEVINALRGGLSRNGAKDFMLYFRLYIKDDNVNIFLSDKNDGPRLVGFLKFDTEAKRYEGQPYCKPGVGQDWKPSQDFWFWQAFEVCRLLGDVQINASQFADGVLPTDFGIRGQTASSIPLPPVVEPKGIDFSKRVSGKTTAITELINGKPNALWALKNLPKPPKDGDQAHEWFMKAVDSQKYSRPDDGQCADFFNTWADGLGFDTRIDTFFTKIVTIEQKGDDLPF